MGENRHIGIFGTIITIIILILLILLTNVDTSKMSYFKSLGDKISRPVQICFTNIKNKITGNSNYFKTMDELKKENDELKKDNKKLSEKLREFEVAKAENKLLKEKMNLTEKYAAYNTVSADVINKDSAVDSMLADIMGDEKERNTMSEEVAVSEQETAVLSEAMSVMSDSTQGSTSAAITDSELEKLFAKNEESELATHNADNPDVLDSKAQILTDSVELSAIFNCEPAGELPDDPELYVIALC